MDLKPVIIALAAATAQTAAAQINSPQSGGYAARAAAMLERGNFQGCIDQCGVALELGANNREQLCWLRAVAAFRGGMPESASLLKGFINGYPASANISTARLMLATLTFYAEDYKSALRQLLELNPNSLNDADREDLAYRMAFCRMKNGNYKQALKEMNALLASKKYGKAAKFYCGYINFADGNFEKALADFAECDTNSEPGNMAGYYVGQILFRQGKYGEALNTLMPLLARKDVSPEFHEEAERIVGESFYATGDDNRALIYLNPYIERHPDDAPLSTRYIVGVERYQMGDHEDAIRLLASVSEATDAMGQSASLTIGQAYQALGNSKAALMAFDKAVKLDIDPKVTELAYYNYASSQVGGGRVPFGGTVQILEDFIRRYPDSRRANTVREYLVKGYIATDDYEGALRSLNAIKGKASDAVLDARQQTNFVLGSRALQAGKPDEAVAYLTEASKYDKRNADIARQNTLWLGDACYAQKNYGKALKQYRAFLKSASAGDPNKVTAQYNMAYAQFGLRDYAAARNSFVAVKNATSLPKDARIDCMNRIADTYYYGKQFGAAKEAYAEAYEMQPSSGDYPLLQMAIMDGHLGKPSEKLSTLDRLIAQFPSSSLRPAAMTEKALTQVATGKGKDAIATYGMISQAYPATAQGRNALLQLGILYDNNGETEKSIDCYRRVITTHPSSSEAAVAVQDLKRIMGDAGRIDELQQLLTSTAGAPQLDAVEVNAIASAALLKKAKAASNADSRLAVATELLDKYPDSEAAEEALLIAARAEFDRGVADKALSRFLELEQRASTSTMRHQARMGILRAARDMGEYNRILSVSEEIMKSSVSSGSDIEEVKFIRAGALASTGKNDSAVALWKQLASKPTEIYGTRSAFELADHYFRSGQNDRALKEAEALIDANPPHAYWLARTFILYSDILRAKGSDFEADEYLRVLRSNYPGSEADIFLMIDQRLPK